MNETIELKLDASRAIAEIERLTACIASLGKLEFSKGEVLAIFVKDQISEEQALRIRSYVEPILPDGVKCIVLDNGMTLAKIGPKPE